METAKASTSTTASAATDAPAKAATAWLRRDFLAVWASQVLSMVGSGMTAFTLAVYVFRLTASVTTYTLVELAWFLPAVVLSPWAGMLVDRLPRRRALLLADLAASLAPLSLGVLFCVGQPRIWQIAATAALISCCSALQWPALSALTSELVPQREIGRASAMVDMGRGLTQVFAPLLAGFLAVKLPAGILFADAGTYLLSTMTLALSIRAGAAGAGGPRSPARAQGGETWVAWRYLRGETGLLLLMFFFSFVNLTLGMVEICLTPLVLSFASPRALGFVLLIGGGGMLTGSVLMSLWRGPRRKTLIIIGLTLAQSTLLVLGGARSSVPVIAALACLYLFLFAIISASNEAIWLTRVPGPMQGRVLGLRRMFDAGSLPLAALISGPLVDRVLDPWLGGGGGMAHAVSATLGIGPGRGLALLYVSLGAVTLLGTCLLALLPQLLALDAAPQTAPRPPTAATHAISERG